MAPTETRFPVLSRLTHCSAVVYSRTRELVRKSGKESILSQTEEDRQRTKATTAAIVKFVQLNPLLVRGIIATTASMVALILGRTVVDSEVVDTIAEWILSLSGIIVAFWARGKVIAENKVIAWNPDPIDTEQIVAGLEVVENIETRIDELSDAASKSESQQEIRAGG